MINIWTIVLLLPDAVKPRPSSAFWPTMGVSWSRLTFRSEIAARKSNRLTWVRQRFPFRDRRDALLAISERLEHATCIRSRRQPEMIFERLACDDTFGIRPANRKATSSRSDDTPGAKSETSMPHLASSSANF
jgi:hypothetical protein